MSVTRYTVKRIVVEEVELLADGDTSALRDALDVTQSSPTYYHHHLSHRIVKQRTEILRRGAPPNCGLDDGGICDRPISHYSYDLKQWLCSKHEGQLRATHETPPPTTPAVQEEVSF